MKIHTHTHTHTHTYIYVCVCVHIYIYIFGGAHCILVFIAEIQDKAVCILRSTNIILKGLHPTSLPSSMGD